MKRIKLKDKVDMTRLFDFGFKYIEEDNCLFKKVYMENDDDDRVCYRINLDDRIVQITRLDGELDTTLYDLMEEHLLESEDR